ncbi:protein Skeletor, isoforms B/C isoform X4 [Epargyreus clarus]|uniref:protein Skeletor, isoforms B/C isoform X4 n=1 Tax=Epargyreus clarus TaxID=520877 RepID=UPI003C2CFA45
MYFGAAATLLLFIGGLEARYFGKEIGALSQLQHGVRGRVFAVDSRTLYLHDLHYDGEGPAAFFYVGTSKSPSATGAIRLRDERGGSGPLRRYRGEGITLSLPDGKSLKDVNWFSIWCDEYAINFGSVDIPRSLEYPKPAKVGGLRGVHGVSSDPVVVVDAQTLLVPNFSYDGEAPDAKFWVGRGDKPSPQGIRIPDENGKESPLRKYDKKTIVLTLPGELTVFDIGHFAVWCEEFTVNFGHIPLPRASLANVPPSLKMLGVSPQSRNKALTAGASPGRPASPPSRLRKPLARLDATTYRPQRLGAGPPALLEHSAAHDHLHRRADNYSPAQQQLLNPQPTKDEKEYDQQIYQQAPQDNQQLYNLQNAQHQQQLYQSQIDQQQLQQQQYQAQNYQQFHQQPQPQAQFSQQQIYQQQSQTQNQQNYQQNQQLQSQPHSVYRPQQGLDRETHDLLYQQQLYEQQRRQLEQELARYRQIQQEDPQQYRLLPYKYEGENQGRYHTEIQRSIDLDLVGGSGPQ